MTDREHIGVENPYRRPSPEHTAWIDGFLAGYKLRGDPDSRPPTRYMKYGGAMMVPDPEGQWLHVQDFGGNGWKLDPLEPDRR